MPLAFTKSDFDELSAPKHVRTTWPAEAQQMSRKAAPSKRRRFIPAFASNDAQLQAVLLYAAVKFIFRDKPLPPGFVADLDTVVELARQRTCEKNRKQYLYEHLLAIENAGGYVAWISAVAYRCWRLQWPAPQVASDLNVNSGFVDRVTQMLACYAEVLGFETYPAHVNRGKIKVDEEAICALWLQVKSLTVVQKQLGHAYATVIRVLGKNGLFTPHKVDEAAIIALWEKGLCVQEIKRQIRSDRKTIQRVIKRHTASV